VPFGWGRARVRDTDMCGWWMLLTRSANAGTDAIRAMDIKRWRARGISDVITRGGRRESLCAVEMKKSDATA
jgi:hypothetical protein